MNCPHCLSSQYSINVTCANCGIIYKALPNWTGLTDEEIWHLSQYNCGTRGEFAKAIEAKLKEKNGMD
jgi:hypothetical protein